jgi:hypothetical protein
VLTENWLSAYTPLDVKNISSRRALLVLHAAFLAGCLGLGLGFGPFRNADTGIAVFTGMLAVAAMATQNALVKLALVDTPSTAVMTTNITTVDHRSRSGCAGQRGNMKRFETF